jgi:hypothetical protein
MVMSRCVCVRLLSVAISQVEPSSRMRWEGGPCLQQDKARVSRRAERRGDGLGGWVWCSNQETKPARNVHTATAADDAAPATEEAVEGGEEGAAAVVATAVKGDEPMGDAEWEAATAAVAGDDVMGDAATAATAAVAAEPTVEVPLPVSSEAEVDAARGAPVHANDMQPETAAVTPVVVETAVAAVAATAAVAAVAATAAVAGVDTDAMQVGEAAVAPMQTDEDMLRCVFASSLFC